MAEKYNIQLASKISGVGVHTIRAWEKRYQAVTPDRNDKGRREYSNTDIERLTLLGELCTLGHSIGQIANIETDELQSMLKKLGKQIDQGGQTSTESKLSGTIVDIDFSLNSLLMALKSYKLDIISHEINKLKLLLSPKDLCLEIISPLLRVVGEQVMRKEMTVSQEHALSSILKFHMGHSLYKSFSQKSTKPYKFLICTPEGDFHEFGVLQAAMLCSHYGFNFVYLGANMPLKSLVDTAKSVGANRIVLGATKGGIEENNFLNGYIQGLLKELPEDSMLLYGGSADFDYEKVSSHKKFKRFLNMNLFDSYLKDL